MNNSEINHNLQNYGHEIAIIGLSDEALVKIEQKIELCRI